MSATVIAEQVVATAHALVANDKGLLAIDESTGTCSARFAKWRAALTIGDQTPSRGCIEANAEALSLYATLCHEAGLVPIVEPEVLMDGSHTLSRCLDVTESVLRAVFAALRSQGVALEAMVLKPNMVLAGSACPTQPSVVEVADASAACLTRTVPAAVPGIAFLSGGQPPPARIRPPERAQPTIRVIGAVGTVVLVGPYDRATGAGDLGGRRRQRRGRAQQVLAHRADCNRGGQYTITMEAA
jgi:fructose-bisphosphate aldolase class I